MIKKRHWSSILALCGIVALMGEVPVLGAVTRAEEGNMFALEIYGRLARQHEGNVFVSPISIRAALALVHAGASGETASQLAKAIHFGPEPEVASARFGQLLKTLNERDGNQFSLANSLWAGTKEPLCRPFQEICQTQYNACLRQVEFASDLVEAERQINEWVSGQTHGKIGESIPPGLLTTSTAIVLVNAVYFEGSWAHRFHREFTKKRPFHLEDGQSVDVFTMNAVGVYNYGEDQDVMVLELPYLSHRLSMWVLLPRNTGSLRRFEESLTMDRIERWRNKCTEEVLYVYLPKFKFTSQLNLEPAMRSLGITEAFELGCADFSRTSSSKELFLSAALHKAYVDVNEEGTIASGATTSVGEPKGERHEFRVDHPFLFLIWDNKTGAILFLGRVLDPAI